MDMSLLRPLSDILEVEIIDILSGEIVDKKDKSEQYEKMIVELLNSTNLNKQRIKKQYYVFEIIILVLTILIVTLSHSELVTILAIILVVVANSFNLAFYVLSKNIVHLFGKVQNKEKCH